MIDHMMGGGMMWGMALIGLLVIIVLLLAAGYSAVPGGRQTPRD